MSEFISTGFNGEVYTLNPTEKVKFPQGDLIKTTYLCSNEKLTELFYQAKIAHLLVPEHTINIIGAYLDPNGRTINDRMYNRGVMWNRDCAKFISKKVSISDAHQKFSSHYTGIGGGRMG